MPGIHLLYTLMPQSGSLTTEKLIHTSEYYSQSLINEDGLSILATRYANYPVEIFENDDFSIIVEGKVYNSNYQALFQQAEKNFKHYLETNQIKSFQKWIHSLSGEYILILYDKHKKILLLLNDPLGRLPLYYHQDHNNFLISREIGFLLENGSTSTFDKDSLALHLLLGFLPGEKTIFETIKRLPPGSLVSIDLNKKEITHENYHTFNFDEVNETNSSQLVADNLTELFLQGCRELDNQKNINIISLSGGLDSRTVAAGFRKCKIDFKTATFLDADNNADVDARLAEQIARKLAVEWELINLEHPTGSDISDYLKLKFGMVSTTQADDFQYHKRLINKFGDNITHISGDGGDKLKSNLYPAKKIKSLPMLGKYILSRCRLFESNILFKLFNISEKKIFETILESISNYPERNYNNRYSHFITYERSMNWLFEGEDRNRFSFWSSTPFYSFPFFTEAIKTPPELKKYNQLYKLFLRNLSASLANITDENKGVSIISEKYKRKAQIIYFLQKYPNLLNFIKSQLTRRSYYSAYHLKLKCLLQQIEKSDSIAEYLDRKYLNDLIKANKLSRSQIDAVFDLTSTIELVLENKPQLDCFKKDSFC